MARVLKRIENEVERQYGIRPHVRDLKPMDGVEFVYCLNLTRCIGCRKCVHACVAENNQSRNPEIQYIRVLQMQNGSFDMEKAEHDYDPEKVPEKGHFYMPVQCQQCKNPPCVKVCPVHATWQETDGITVIDYDWCIGCRYCEAACPYWARHFNFTKPSIPKERINPNMAYLGNRPRRQGVMEKCHFCIQRTRAGRYPACVEVCPPGRGSSATSSIPTARSPTSSKTSGSSSSSRRNWEHRPGFSTTSTYDAQPIRNYFVFLRRCARIAFVGDWRYYAWMGVLTVFCMLGLNAYAKQFANGLIVTGMSDQVSWGVYIANFTFLVGVAAAAVMMVIPVYIYDNEELHDLVIFGELLAVAAIIMCLAFVTVDLGRPDRFWHLIPGLGQLNFPASMLSWDVIVLNGYLLLNVHICGYLLYCRYHGENRPVVLHSVCFHRDLLGCFDPHGYRISLRGIGWAAILEPGHYRSALPCLGLHGRAGADHSGAASHSPRHAIPHFRQGAADAARHRAGCHDHQRFPVDVRSLHGILRGRLAYRVVQVPVSRLSRLSCAWCPGFGRPSLLISPPWCCWCCPSAGV